MVRILIFPIDLDESIQFASFARSLGFFVLGVSSVRRVSEADIDVLAYLPYVTATEFDEAFDRVIEQHSITHVYTPHSAVWTHVNQLRKRKRYVFHLCSPSPFEADWQKYERSYLWAETVVNDRLAYSLGTDRTPRNHLTNSQYAGLHKQFIQIPGQCDDEKLLSLASVFRLVPEGDVVEIGALYGRSAYAMGWLAKKYQIGNVVCVDPWDIEKTENQGGAANTFLNPRDERIDTNKIFKIFLTTASNLSNIGFIREKSDVAVDEYIKASSDGIFRNEECGEITLEGKIALLHIDGNHKYEYVQKDIETWFPHIVSGGWLLLDDYVWAFGDGPKKAGDELLKKCGFDIAFCLADTLYLRKA